jgi:hypothetical protein
VADHANSASDYTALFPLLWKMGLHLQHVPAWLGVCFVLTTSLAVFMFLRASQWSRSALAVLLLWATFVGALSMKGFFTVTAGSPPRFAIAILPPLSIIAALFLTKGGRRWMDKIDHAKLTLVHVVRIPVELVLFGLFLHGAVPQLMTFEGRNWDILSGITAPLVWFLGYRQHTLPRWVLFTWNLVCLGLLFNIVGNAILAAPFDFQ